MEPIFRKPLVADKTKVYKLEDKEVQDLLMRRGSKVELDPGMGGVSPRKLDDFLNTTSKLVSLDMAITSGCNFKCIWCYRPGEEWGRQSLDFGTIERTIGEAAELGVRYFVITGGEPLMYKNQGKGYFQIVDKILETYGKRGEEAKVLTFSDVALITPDIAGKLAERKVGLCLKRDSLNNDVQDVVVGVEGGAAKMRQGYSHLFEVGYGQNPELAVSVNSVLAKGIMHKEQQLNTLDGMIDLHRWVRRNGMEHSIVPIHYCGEAIGEEQRQGIHPLDIKALYDILAEIDRSEFHDEWTVFSAFPKNKTCNRPGRGVHIRATGKVTSCSESPLCEEYVFGDINTQSLTSMIVSPKFQDFRDAFNRREGKYICNPDACDLNGNFLCKGGCATRSAYSKINPQTGLIEQNTDILAYNNGREDPLCPGWIVLAKKQGALKPGVYEAAVSELLERSSLDIGDVLRIKQKVISDFIGE